VALFTIVLIQTRTNLVKKEIVARLALEESNREILHQKTIVEEQNKDIRDSIHYAQRIQFSMLPNEEKLSSAIDEHFILYKPKDIVSGDFYWYHKLSENEFFIACADCTGHGVPGGFMSMICTEKLNESLNYTTEPDEMLKHVNMVLKNALRQDGETGSTKDGMEIALLKINSHLKTVRYSGANRFLWIIRNNADFIEEIKPVKTGIGGTTPSDQNFETHELIIQAGDSVYMSSDGYADQFGGTDARRNGKKFMTKNFKTLLLSIKDMPMKDQGEALDTTIQKWKGDYEQVDDILVIGLRF
jgi:serine phosphatase RsbU (regulator of sigma subunit)